MIDWLVGGVVLGLLALALRVVWKNMKKGGCAGGCSGCGKSCACSKNPPESH